MGALPTNNTWNLVPPVAEQHVLLCKWTYKFKQDKFGNITKHKAGLVTNGMRQQDGIGFRETFTLTVKPATIRLVLSIAI